MKRLKHILFFTLTLLCIAPTTTKAQTRYCFGIDTQLDSIAFEHFGRHLDSIRLQRPTVAVVLSGGGAKGAAHIPVLRLLDSIGMPVDLVIGTSIGSLVGGLYAVGYPGSELEELMRSQDWDYIMRDTHPRRFDALSQKDYDSRFIFGGAFGLGKWELNGIDNNSNNARQSLMTGGMIHGRNVEDFFGSLLVGYCDTANFLDFPIPFICVATDMVTAKPKVWHSGNLITALRSSMSIPGYFTPVKDHGMVLFDGGMLNNMPANIARKLGADIIIAVDISSPPLDADQINSLMDIVYQTNDVMAREAYLASLAATDIYIQPDVNGFGLLSFDAASISQLIGQGYDAVKPHIHKLDSLAAALGRVKRPPTRAMNINKRSVAIDTVTFVGVNDKESHNLNKLIKLDSTVTKRQLDDAIAILMGTHTLEKVSYQLLGDTMPYKLQFRCRRSPLNELGASARFDALDFASLLVHGGIGTRRLTGHRFDLILRLGLNTKAELSYTYRSGHSMDFGGILSFQALREGGVRDKSHRLSIDFNRYRLDAFMAFLPFKQMRMQTGIRMDAFYRVSMLSDTNIDFSTIHESDIWPVFYALMRSDSFDDAYFPTNGIQFMGFYSWTPGGIRHDGPGVHTWHTSFHAAMSSEGVTLLPFFEARYVSATVMPYVNILAVSNANRCLDQQIVFMGINTAHSAMRTLLTAGFNLRRPIGSRHNIIAGMQVLHHAPDIKSFDAPQLSETCWGISLEYAYNSIIGPMRFNVHWSDMAKKLGFYLGIGLDF